MVAECQDWNPLQYSMVCPGFEAMLSHFIFLIVSAKATNATCGLAFKCAVLGLFLRPKKIFLNIVISH